MARRSYLWAAVLLSVAGLAGCVSTSAGPAASLPPDLPPGGTSTLSQQEIDVGRKLYIAKCARCHKFYDPANYNAGEWRNWMNKMSRKAKLQPEQREQLERYLDAFRTGGRSDSDKPGPAEKL